MKRKYSLESLLKRLSGCARGMAKWLRDNVPDDDTLSLTDVGQKLIDEKEWDLLLEFAIQVIGTRSIPWRKLIRLVGQVLSEIRDKIGQKYPGDQFYVDLALVFYQYVGEGKPIDRTIGREISNKLAIRVNYILIGPKQFILNAAHHALNATIDGSMSEEETKGQVTWDVTRSLIWVGRASSDPAQAIWQNLTKLFAL